MADNNNSSNSNDNSKGGTMSRSEAGKLGAQAQPTEAKAKGGRNSHSGGRRSNSDNS